MYGQATGPFVRCSTAGFFRWSAVAMFLSIACYGLCFCAPSLCKTKSINQTLPTRTSIGRSRVWHVSLSTRNSCFEASSVQQRQLAPLPDHAETHTTVAASNPGNKLMVGVLHHSVWGEHEAALKVENVSSPVHRQTSQCWRDGQGISCSAVHYDDGTSP